MNDQPRLSEVEWVLVLDLLQHELDELPVEIHHTRTNEVREELVARREMIRALVERLRPIAAAPTA
jgi:hypothetical protein